MLGKKQLLLSAGPNTLTANTHTHTLYTPFQRFISVRISWISFSEFYSLFFFSDFLSLLLILSSLLERRKNPPTDTQEETIVPFRSPFNARPAIITTSRHFRAFQFPPKESHFGLEVPFSSLLRSLPPLSRHLWDHGISRIVQVVHLGSLGIDK